MLAVKLVRIVLVGTDRKVHTSLAVVVADLSTIVAASISAGAWVRAARGGSSSIATIFVDVVAVARVAPPATTAAEPREALQLGSGRARRAGHYVAAIVVIVVVVAVHPVDACSGGIAVDILYGLARRGAAVVHMPLRMRLLQLWAKVVVARHGPRAGHGQVVAASTAAAVLVVVVTIRVIVAVAIDARARAVPVCAGIAIPIAILVML